MFISKTEKTDLYDKLSKLQLADNQVIALVNSMAERIMKLEKLAAPAPEPKPVEASRLVKYLNKVGRGKRKWSDEQRKAQSDRIKAMWAKKKGA